MSEHEEYMPLQVPIIKPSSSTTNTPTKNPEPTKNTK